MPRSPALGLAAVFSLTLAACVPSEGIPSPPAVGEPAPLFDGASLDGTPMSLADFEGSPLLLNVWATWCAPCRHETPFLQGLYEEYGEGGLQVLGISVDGASSADAVREFRSEYAVTYPMIHDPDGVAMDRFFVVGLPATFLIDGEGVIRLIRLGPVDETDAELMTLLEELTQ